MKSRKVFLRGLDGACGEGGEGICFFWAGVLGRDTGHSSGSGRDFLLSWIVLGGDDVGAGGVGAGVEPEAEDWSFLDLELLLLLLLPEDAVREVLVADGDDVRADFLVGGPELWLAVCPRATRPDGVLSTAPVAEDCL